MFNLQCLLVVSTLFVLSAQFSDAAVSGSYRPRVRTQYGRQYAQPGYVAQPAPVPARRYAAVAPARYNADQTGAYVPGPEENYAPQPHNFNYDVTDEYGNQRYHQESGDGSGRVTGSYGYRDAYGVYRYVDYVADENGFRATIRSNEPGVNNPAPANVQYALEQPPANVYLGASKAPAARNY